MDPTPENARPARLEPVADIASRLDLPAGALCPYGSTMAKLDHRLAAGEPAAGTRYVLVTAITPTRAGEGKTVQAIGLAQALARLGRRAACTLRQPSMGPVFGIKGGGAGGGLSQVLPREELDLHLTGDFHAVGAATNLLAAAIDSSALLENPLSIDPETITWRRVVDVNDRALRQVRIGLGGPENGIPRDTGFDITAASEVMAVLGLSEDLRDMRARLGRIVVAQGFTGREVTAEQLGVAGAMAAILQRALDPTLMQTSEHTPAFVHTGPFANIAHGCSSIVADRLAARCCDYVVTEAGFGADLGAEKFFDIKCRASGMRPDVAVLVATVRALKAHSKRPSPEPGQAGLAALDEGCCNLEAHLEALRSFGVPVVVAVNRFAEDSDEELERVRRRALEAGAQAAEVSDVHARGGAGGLELARAVEAVCEAGAAELRYAYELEAPLEEKLRALACGIYGAGSIELAPEALTGLRRLEERGHGRLPVCVAKTPYSLSHDPRLRGRPRGFAFPIRELRLAAGAGFVVAAAGDIQTMPGLGRSPNYRRVDLDAEGRITGLA